MARRKTVLIVDDSTAQLESLSGAFEEAGYGVATATDGEQVFRKLAQVGPEALILDVYMPRLNGADVCRLVKAHPHWRRTFLVLMSGRISEKELETYRRIGADDVLRKPFEPEDAVARVARAIGPAEIAD
jgi:twitching motility two-component system response regulator PilG/twitching motility two-component system response regulator PilH